MTHRRIELPHNFVALIDTADWPLVSEHNWHRSSKRRGYAQTNIPHPRGYGQTRLKMHRLIMGLAYGDRRIIDHVNGDRLDNRRHNLRICTSRQNSQNRPKHRLGRLVGAIKHGRKLKKPWVSMIRVGRRMINLGYYATERAAHNAYMEAADAISRS